MKRKINPPARLNWPANEPISLSNKNEIPASFESKQIYQGRFNDQNNTTMNQNKSSTEYKRISSNEYMSLKISNHAKLDYNNEGTKNLWTDKYSNVHNVKDLCVQPRKVEEVRKWFKSTLAMFSQISISENGYGSKLLLLVGIPGTGKSTMCRVLANEFYLNLLEWNDTYSASSTSYYRTDNSLLSCPYQSQMNSFEEFLQSAGRGCRTLNLTTSDFKKRSMILLEEIPNLHSAKEVERFRSIMANHINTTKIPTILIISNISEGKASPSDLEKIIPASILYEATKVKVIHCNAVTQAKIKKCLESIALKEQIRIPKRVMDQIQLNSGGDLRNAIMTLQFQLVGSQEKRRISVCRGTELVEGQQYHRDLKLSAFHALGKLLYAKRETNNFRISTRNEKWKNERPPLTFVPEDVINSSEMSHEGIVSFLSYHCPDFYTDEFEICQALQLFSDTAVLLNREFNFQKSHSDKTFPLDYVSSLAGRTIAVTNGNPAPKKFRALGAPKIFDVSRKKKWNDIKIQQLRKKFSFNIDNSRGNRETILPLDASIGCCTNFMTDYLPFMRRICPNEINNALSDLYSIQSPIIDQSHMRKNEKNSTDDEDIIIQKIKYQQQILSMDDIIDEDDDNEYKSKSVGKVTRNPNLPIQRPPKAVTKDNPSDSVIIIDC